MILYEVLHKLMGRSSRNEIKAIKNAEGIWTTGQLQIKRLFLESFKEIYQCGRGNGIGIQHKDLFFAPVSTLSQHHIDLLSMSFSSKEIKEACFSSKILKSPGPDGTPPAFFHQNWNIVGTDVINSVNSFLSSGFLLKEQNRTFITLIPKKDRPQETKDQFEFHFSHLLDLFLPNLIFFLLNLTYFAELNLLLLNLTYFT